MVYRIIRTALESGVRPDAIEHALPGGRVRLPSLDGERTGDDFQRCLPKAKSPRGTPLSPRDFFLDDKDLVLLDDHTYAVSNRWGGKYVRRNLDALNDAFPALGIEYRESASSET
jgi:hypothetical protein